MILRSTVLQAVNLQSRLGARGSTGQRLRQEVSGLANIDLIADAPAKFLHIQCTFEYAVKTMCQTNIP
jgi:hypothetical protein